jgi:universal stress protein A
MLKRILVPVDFSPCSRAALDYAALLAEIFHAELDLLHIWAPSRRPEDRELATLGLASSTVAGRALTDWLMSIGPALRERARGRLEVGDRCGRILEAALGYDLIVMGTNGRTGMAHLFRGSLAEKVVRRAACPVLTIRPAEGTVPEPAFPPFFAGEMT